MRHEFLSVGVAEIGSIIGAAAAPSFYHGKKIFVDPVNGASNGDGSASSPLASLKAAYDLCTAGKNDTVYYIAGTSATTNLTAALVWSKSYTHLVGLCAPIMFSPRARVFATGAFSPMVTFSGQGCMIENIEFFHGIDGATALGCVLVSGGRNKFKNVHFAGMGHATTAAEAAGYSLQLSDAEENVFENCVIGIDTVAREAANAELILAAASRRNLFLNCLFPTFAGSSGATHLFISQNASGAVDRFNLFQKCRFINAVKSTATTMTAGIADHASAGGMLILDNCWFLGATDVQAGNLGNVLIIDTPVLDTADGGIGAAQTAS